jgi:hypothetical protein
MKFRFVLWDVLQCKIIVDRRFRGMMEAARTSETSIYNYFTWQYILEDNSELHIFTCFIFQILQFGKHSRRRVIVAKYFLSLKVNVMYLKVGPGLFLLHPS